MFSFYRLVLGLVCSVVLMMPLALQAQSGAGAASEYTLGSGDKISILVYDEDDLGLETKLSDAGTLNYPFLGRLRVVGLTVSEVQTLITEGLRGDYLIEPKVSVSISEYRQFFVNGEVKRPGGFAFLPGLTIGKAVSLAEGFTERASRKNIYVISDNDSTQKARKVSLNSPVQPGDIITIKQSFF